MFPASMCMCPPPHAPCQATAVTLVEFPRHLKGRAGGLFGCFLFIPSRFQRLHHGSLTSLDWDKVNIVVESTVEQSFPLLGGQEVQDREAVAATYSLQPYTAFCSSLLGRDPSVHYVVDVTFDFSVPRPARSQTFSTWAFETIPCPNHKICPSFP